jgi:ABC-type branched-subunit amino acid transport system substrate-binding protein
VATGRYRFFAGLSDRYGEAIDFRLASDLAKIEDEFAARNDVISRDPAHRTIVYLSDLTPNDPRALPSELEELRGLTIAQSESAGTRAPLRILLANGGDSLRKADQAADSIAAAADSDPSLVAVTGLSISVDATRVAVSRLAAHRLPTVSTLLSASELATLTSQYYHQVGPTNAREAKVAAYFSRGVKTAVAYYSGDSSDKYSGDLASKFRDAMKEYGVDVQLTPYESKPGTGDGRPVNELGQDACSLAKGQTGLAFYSGRSDRLLEFLRGMKSSCEGTYPKVLLGDDVNRFATETGFREFPGLDVNYLSFASSLSWPGQQCEGARDSSGFYRSYLFTFGSCGSTRNGTAAIAYDAALVLRVAIERARQDTDTPPSSDLILSKINEMTVGNGVTGASGSFEITKQYEQGRVPVNKAIVVLNSKGGNSPTAVLLCGRLDTADPPADPGCPTDLGR